MEWVSVKNKMPPERTPVVLLNINTTMAYDPYGKWKGVGVLIIDFGMPYWSIIGEKKGLVIDSVTHWMPIPPDFNAIP